jgi:hypothetical protein
MTRRQLAKQEEELSKSQRMAAPTQAPHPVAEETVEEPAHPQPEQENSTPAAPEETVVEAQESHLTTPEVEEIPAETQEPQVHAEEIAEPPVPEVIAPEVEVTSEPEPKTLTSEKPCESELATPTPSRTSSRSPSKSPAKTPMRLEESFIAIDALEEALENVIPNFNPELDDKSPKKAKFPTNARGKPTNAVKKSPLATSKVSRNPSAPKSLKPAAVPASSLARSSSVRAPPKERKGSGEVADYLAAKRRPISMQFPTPPPPPKSKKAPTTSSFQLPGEAIAAKLKAQKKERLKREEGRSRPLSASFVGAPKIKSSKPPTTASFQLPGEAIAAKLKAQKEERLKREAEGLAERPSSTTFQAPAPPKSSKPPTVPNFQLPGEAIAAKLKAQREERLKREAEGLTERPSSAAFKAPAPPKSSKPPTVPNFQLPGEAIAAKLKAQREERMKREEEEAAKKAAFKARPAPIMRSGSTSVRQTAASKARQSLIIGENDTGLKRTGSVNAGSKRNSTILCRPTLISTVSSSSSDSKRNSLVITKSNVTAADAATQRLKGKEIFNRDKLEKERREQERREKEEAAKKARAMAAERGRIASREWAEKQKRKLMGGGAKVEAA